MDGSLVVGIGPMCLETRKGSLHYTSEPPFIFSCSFYPTTPALKTLAWGFIPISTHLDTYASYTNLHLVGSPPPTSKSTILTYLSSVL